MPGKVMGIMGFFKKNFVDTLKLQLESTPYQYQQYSAIIDHRKIPASRVFIVGVV